MTDWDLMTPGIGLTTIGIAGVGMSLSGIAKTFIDGMHAVSLLTMFIGMIFLASGLFKDGFPSTGRAKSATFITLGFLVTFGVAAAVTVSVQVPSIFAYIGLMTMIAIPAAVLAVVSYRKPQYTKALGVIFIAGAAMGGITFYAFGLVAPRPPEPPVEEEPETPAAPAEPPANIVTATIPMGASAQGNVDYDPDPVVAAQGDGVEWTNLDNLPHTVTSLADDGAAFDSSIISPNAKWLLDTSELSPAEYEYYCTVHPTMTAFLQVTEPGASGTTTEPSGNETATGNQTTPGETTGNQTAPGATSGENTTPATVTAVSIVVGSSTPTNGEFYSPEVVETSVGSMVTWTNEDAIPHTVTSGVSDGTTVTPDGVFDSNLISKGATFSWLPEQAGEYDYYCFLHPFMTGQVVVS
ncbi:plastocyanin/azurin family copper-binding protein [Candidatus Nitrososphaera sp. FF02]|uniref:cupredoxin domain-containing protein n=1 Tax=Candidatus Nitrososphaera sp. FF02 TaxID=3398226 RepID=UPI0039E7BA87